MITLKEKRDLLVKELNDYSNKHNNERPTDYIEKRTSLQNEIYQLQKKIRIERLKNDTKKRV